MQTEWNENKILLRGRVAAPPQFSHSNHGVDYYLFPLTVLRLSGAGSLFYLTAYGASPAPRPGLLFPRGKRNQKRARTYGSGLPYSGPPQGGVHLGGGLSDTLCK